MSATDQPSHVAALSDLHRVLLLLNSGQSLDDVLHAAAQGVSDVLGFGGVVVNLMTPHGFFEVAVVVGPAKETLTGGRYDAEEFLAELAVADEWGLLRFVPAGRYVYGEDVVWWTTDDPPVDGPDAWQAEDALYAPLRGPEDDLIGILGLDLPRDGRRPGPEARAILEMYAVQIGFAVSQARERERLRERVRLSAVTRRVVSTASQALELNEVLGACITPLLEGFRAGNAWIRLFPESGGAWGAVNFPADLEDVLHLSVAHEGEWPDLDVQRAFRTAARVSEECWVRRRTLVISADQPDSSSGIVSPASRERVLDWLRALGHAQFVLVPLGSAQQCLGYLVLSRAESAGPWTEAEEDAAMDVGRELGRVIGAARVRERERELVRRLEELDAYRTEFITTVVHELKNPLAAIIGNLEMVRDDPAVAERAHHAIEASGERMLSLVQDMLTLTRLRQPGSVEHADVDLSEVVREVAVQLATHADRAGVRLDLGDLQPRMDVRGDREEIEQMTLNLISNAIKFSDPGDVVRLDLHPSGDHGVEVVLQVTDQGMGISAEDQQVLFTEFERGSNAEARRRPGSGLGLAIASRVAERHRGRIEIESRPGRGSTFTVRLPRAPA